MDINKLDSEIDIAGLSIYTNKVNSGVRYLKMRQFCIDSGEDVSEKDHQYGLAETIVDLMKKGTPELDIIGKAVPLLMAKENISECNSIGFFEHGSGASGLLARSALLDAVRSAKRGSYAVVIIAHENFDKNYDVLISNGFGKVISSKSIGKVLKEVPSTEMCLSLLAERELKVVFEKIQNEINRQCNFETIKLLKMRAGMVVDGVVLAGFPTVKKIKVNKIDESGGVHFEVLSAGVAESKRVKKYMNARTLLAA